MSHPCISYVSDAISTNWADGSFSDVNADRVDADEAQFIDGSIRTRQGKLEVTNLITIAYTDRQTTPIGTEYDHEGSVTIRVRLEGLHYDRGGWITPGATTPPTSDGDAIPFTWLVEQTRDAILSERTYPSVSNAQFDFTDLQLAFEDPQSSNYADYFLHQLDIRFDGYEELP